MNKSQKANPLTKGVILIPKSFLKFQKVKNKLKKTPLISQKSKIILNSKKSQKTDPPNVAIMIKKPLSDFKKVKKPTQKDPFKIRNIK